MRLLSRALCAALALALASCAAPDAPQASSPMPDGQAVAPPDGWFGYCLRNPLDERCRPAPPLADRTAA